MEALTTAVRDFMGIAYRKGLLDELLRLSGVFAGQNADLSDLLAKVEDTLADADFTPFEKMANEVLVPMLKALSNEEVVEGLKGLLSTTRPVVEGVVDGVGGDVNVILDIVANIKKNILIMTPVVSSLLPVISNMALPSIEIFLKEHAGRVVGNTINSSCAMINKINDRDPKTLSAFFSDLFATVDSVEFKKATDRLVGGVLDQKPPLFGWAVGTAVARMKKRFTR